MIEIYASFFYYYDLMFILNIAILLKKLLIELSKTKNPIVLEIAKYNSEVNVM